MLPPRGAGPPKLRATHLGMRMTSHSRKQAISALAPKVTKAHPEGILEAGYFLIHARTETRSHG
jgi:hypothetical protein